MEVTSGSSEKTSQVFVAYDEAYCKYLCEYINMSPFNIIELLPMVKRGILSYAALEDLIKIVEMMAPNEIRQKTKIGNKLQWYERYRSEVACEHTIISTIRGLLFNNFIGPFWTIYDFASIICSSKFREEYEITPDYLFSLRRFVRNSMEHPKLNPLFISFLLGEDLEKYLQDTRSAKIPIYKYCYMQGIIIPKLIVDEIFGKTLLCKSLPLNNDVYRYILLLGVF